MKTILDVYKEYKIMPSLGEHMLRVASVASLICDNFTLPIDKQKIIAIALLHDMGNIIKSRLDIFPEFVEPEGLGYWEQVKNDFILKFGNDEHQATVAIINELGLPESYAVFANKNRFSMLCAHKNDTDFNVKILHYSDMRVSPHGVMSYEDRQTEARSRYKDFKSGITEKERDMLYECGRAIEKQIFEKCKIKPEDITDESISSLMQDLKSFVIKSN